jgi:hypothetical protein
MPPAIRIASEAPVSARRPTRQRPPGCGLACAAASFRQSLVGPASLLRAVSWAESL